MQIKRLSFRVNVLKRGETEQGPSSWAQEQRKTRHYGKEADEAVDFRKPQDKMDGQRTYLNIARQKDQRMRGPCKLKPFRVFMKVWPTTMSDR